MIATRPQRTTAPQTRAWYSTTALTIAVSISVLSTPAGAQSSKGPSSSIIAGGFQVASPGGSLRGESMLATGSLSLPIPAPFGGGTFDMQRRTSAGPFGSGTTFMPTVTGSSLDTGSEVLTFTQGNSPYRSLGDKTTLIQKDGGYLLSNPDQGIAFFGQKTSSGAYALSYSEGLNKVRTTFAYSPGSAVPSRISLNNGEKAVTVSSDGRGLITSIAVDGSVTSYQYTTSGAKTLLSEIRVDGTSILKLTWERDLPVSATDGYGQRTLFAYTTQFNNPNEAVLSGLSSPDGSISTFSYKGLITDVEVNGVAYRYQWGFNPVTGRSYPKIVERGARTISITKVDPFSGRLLATEDEFGRSTTYTWDSKGSAWPLQVSLPDGTKVTNALDGNGDLISSTETSSTGFVTVHYFSYDQLRRLTSQSSKGSNGESSRTTQLTYSGDRRVPDTVKESETRRIDFSPRGLLISASARGATSTLSMKNGGRELSLSRNGVPTTYSTNASPAGARTTSMTSPFVRTNSFVDTFGRSQSFTTSVLGRIPGSSPRSLANALDSGLITNAFAATNDASWLPFASTNRTRSGSQGNYVWSSTTTTSEGTKSETTNANFNQGTGQCSTSGTCQFVPAASNTPPPQPSVAPPAPPQNPGPPQVPSVKPQPQPPYQPPYQPPSNPPQQPPTKPSVKPEPPAPGDCCPPGNETCCRERFGKGQCRACAPKIT